MMPRLKSVICVSCICCPTFRNASKKLPLESNFSPNSPFNWETAIITEVAEVNPTVTGIDMKSISTPVNNYNVIFAVAV